MKAVLKKFRTVAALLACILLASMMAAPSAVFGAAGAKKESTNRYNIVFVNDESGSMSYSDGEKLRYEAIRIFVALMAQNGNRIGSVSFNDKVVDSVPMKTLSTFEEKNEFIEHLAKFSPTANMGLTNIGLALKTAVELLESGGDPSLPSIIILLTDGATQLSSTEEKEESLEQKADALEAARKNGYNIYSICLGDGAHEKELEQIASATGGEYAMVKTAEDLEDVQMMFYKIIFSALTESPTEAVIGANGEVSQSFTVPGIGVEELNVIIEGSFTDCSLTDPEGKVYKGSDLQDIAMSGRNFRLIKIANPVGGKWTATAYGDTGAKIKFKPLYNSAFFIDCSMTKKDEYKIGDTVTFEAVICDQSGAVTQTSLYEGFEGVLHLTAGGEEKEIPMTLGDGGFTYDYKIEDEGTYYAYITVAKGDLEARSEEDFEFSVNNSAPLPPEETPTAHANVWPIFGGSAKLDLSDAATDPDGDAITYSIESSAFNEEDYSFEDNVLTVSNFSIKKGSFTIRATDARGAYCTFDVMMTSTNIGLVLFLAVCAGALIVVGVMGFLAWKITRNHINGDVKVEIWSGASCTGKDEKDGYDLPRGKVYLSYFSVDVTEYIPGKSWLQVQSKKAKYIYLVTKTPVYCELNPNKKAKKHKIQSSLDGVMFNKDPDTSVGVKITFTHNEDKNMW